jgi:DNA polymerase I-like protein with 3'-5' exonuclease and polymerase domains
VLVNADAKALEWLGAVYLSKDPIGYEEIKAGIDQHKENQKVFGFKEGPEGRLIAKRFVFRLIYGGSAYSYANDPDFAEVSTKEKFWQGVIDKFYNKYSGIKLWHESLMEEAMSTGQVVIPTGRVFTFSSERKRGKQVWPRTTILNYPVQGFGADLMVLARVEVNRRLCEIPSILPCCTVHDSILMDCPVDDVATVVRAFFHTWECLPRIYHRTFGSVFDLPMRVEVMVGMDWKHMTEVKDEA